MTWPPSFRGLVSPGPEVDKPYIAVDNSGGPRDGRVYVAYTTFGVGGSAIYLSYSTDHGATFLTEPRIIEEGEALPEAALVTPYIVGEEEEKGGDEEVLYVHGAFPVVAPNGDLLVSYVQSPTFLSGGVVCTLKVVRSTDGGDSFEIITTQEAIQCVARVPANGFQGYQDIKTYASAMLAVSPYYGDIYLAFTQLVGNDPKAFFIRSTNNGSTWGNPICLTPPSMSGWQYWPWIAVTPSGDLSIALRHSEDMYLSDIVSVFSGNRGETFDAPLPVADYAPGNPRNAIGRCHYIGHAAIQGNSFPVWDDYRNAIIGRESDVYWTSIDLPPSKPKNFDVDVVYDNPPYNSHPRLRWAQPLETDIASYDIYRRIVDAGPPPNPGSWALYTNQSAPLTEWIDYSIGYAGSGQFAARYKIKAIDQPTQESVYSDSDQVNFGNLFKQTKNVDQNPEVLQLHQNSPNPFNPIALIGFDVPDDGNVILRVFDVLGREVAALVNEFKTAGRYTIRFDAANLASGVYLYRLQQNRNTLIKKMIVAK